MTKKKNKRQRPSRREAERAEQQQKMAKLGGGQQGKRPRQDYSDDDDEPQFRQKQQQKQKQPQQKQKQQQQQPQQKPKQKAVAASAADAAPAKKKKKAAAAEEEEASAPDAYNTTPLDGLAIAFGESSVPAAATFAAAAAPSAESELRTPAGLELDSGMTAHSFFEWLIWPMTAQAFFDNYFEKRPLFISRAKVAERARSYATLVSTKKDLVDYLPENDPSVHTGPAAANKAAAPVMRKDLKTKANALRTERVTEVEVSSLADRIAPAGAASSAGLLSHYYSNWFSIPDIHALLADPAHDIRYRSDVDITRYRNGARETLNPAGRASDEQVRHFLSAEQQCSLRFLCPQKYSPRLWRMLSLLDETLGMQTGANSYYTPKGTQGFAPHYDDVDVLVIQTEGAKRWRLYPPRHATEILPSVSSRNFAQEEIGQPIMDVLLCAGDFLYAPRGTIHQCVASPEEHSLHVTLSTCLHSSWADFFRAMLPRMLDLAAEESIDMRRSMPHRYDTYMGVMHAEGGGEDGEAPPSTATSRRKAGRRAAFMDRFMGLLTDMVDEERMPFDAAADQLQTAFMHGRVPPALDRKHAAIREKQGLVPITGAPNQEDEGEDAAAAEEATQQKDAKSKAKAGASAAAQGTSAVKAAAASAAAAQGTKKVKLGMGTCVRLVKDGVARLTTSPKGDSLLLHHILNNSRLYQGAPLSSLEFPLGYAGALETLLSSYPRFTPLSRLPLPEPDEEDEDAEQDDSAGEQDLLDLVQSLLEEGLLDVLPNEQAVPEELRARDDEEDDEADDGGEDEEELGEDEEGEDGEEEDMDEGEDEEEAGEE